MTLPRRYSIEEVAEAYGISTKSVRAMIRSGELRAINMGRNKASAKPRWRIPAEALEALEAARATSAEPQRQTSRRKVVATREWF